METLTSIQEAAIVYLHSRTRKNDFRVKRKASRMVREFCEARGYSETEIRHCIRDMWDVYKLEAGAES